MAIFATKWRIHVLDMPLRAPVRWANHAEDRISVVLLELETSNGARGVAEMAVRKKWHGEDVAGVVRALDTELLPHLRSHGIGESDGWHAGFQSATASALAKAIAGMAIVDILAQCAGLPLAGYLAGFLVHEPDATPDRVPVSFTITRDEPAAMGGDAAQTCAVHGARAFKVKTGQGLAVDTKAIEAIRAAARPDIFLSADSNSAGPPDGVRAMADMLQAADVRWFEDPCRLQPDASFVDAQMASRLPVLVDNACRSVDAAKAFLSLGAKGLSVKLMKTGIGPSLEIVRMAAGQGARVTIGICAATSLSAACSLSLFAALPDRVRAMPCEETFFINLDADIAEALVTFENGEAVLPKAGPLADRLDWRAIDRLAVAGPKPG